MAKTNPFEFLQQVREEGAKVTWPSRRETMISTVMVFIMVAIAAVFFLAVDAVLHRGVQWVLGHRGLGRQHMAKRWYIVHAYSNFEKKVAESIKEQAAQKGLADQFEQVLVPTEEVIEVRRGRKIKSERRFFPGYVLVKMDLTDQAFHLIKNTPKVTGFLGSDFEADPDLGCRGLAHPEPGGRGRRAPEVHHHLRSRRAGARRRWSFCFLLRPGGGSRRRTVAAQGRRVHLRQAHACRTRVRPGREAALAVTPPSGNIWRQE